MAKKVIGGPLDQDVLAQIELRRDIMRRSNRSNNDLMYLNSRTGWAKLSSGVNTSKGSALAKEYVLIAGQYGKHGADSYSNYTKTVGFRPMPGIVDVDIRSINRFGVLKEATINFTCWSVTQLTDLEQLYMRPGFSALLEWGHSIYVRKNSKTGNAEYDSKVEAVPNFFDGGYTKAELYSKINELKTQSAYNYDAIFGFVKNFSWSYRADGGYDCTTTIISIGEIVESLQVLLDVTSHSKTSSTDSISAYTRSQKMLVQEAQPQSDLKQLPSTSLTGTPSAPTTDENPQATVLQGVLNCIKNWTGTKVWSELTNKYPNFTSRFADINGNAIVLGLTTLGTVDADGSLFQDSISITDTVNGDGTTTFNYISFRTFCQVINALTLVDQTGEPLSRISVARGNLYRTFKYHESIDPSTCIITSSPVSYFHTAKPDLQKWFQTVTGGSGDVMDILLNVDMILGIVADLISKPADQRDLFSIFSAIFAKVNLALGEINDLAFHVDETNHYYHIVDRHVSVKTEDLSILDITGLSSTVSKFDFTTKLAPALTTMIAISAQAGAADVGVEASALLRWNEGLSDRIISSRGQTSKASTDKEIETQQATRESIYGLFLSTVYRDKQFDTQKLTEAQRTYSQYAATYLNKYEGPAGGAGPAGIIPFEVGIDLDGISGIKIGQAFRINKDIMPEKYEGVVGFIVTGVSHKILGNKWITSLKAQTVVLAGGNRVAQTKTREIVLPGFSSSAKSTKLQDAKISSNQVLVKQLLQVSGLSKVATAGVMGNILKESTFDPKAVNKRDRNGYPSVGLIQWNGRYIAGGTKDSEAVFNVIGRTVTAQIEYLLTKYPTYKTWLNEVSKVTEAYEAGYLFAKTVEICHNCNKGRETYEKDTTYKAADRSKFAQDFYNRFNTKGDPLYWD